MRSRIPIDNLVDRRGKTVQYRDKELRESVDELIATAQNAVETAEGAVETANAASEFVAGVEEYTNEKASAAAASATAAAGSATEADGSAAEAAESETAAAGSATAANTSATQAAESAAAADASATAAASSASAASTQALDAQSSASLASEKASDASLEAAAAATSATAAAESATTAGNQASAASGSATEAAGSATAAAGKVTEAAGKVADAEAWAVGQRNGTDVASTDGTYHNNAKHYAETAANVLNSIPADYSALSSDVTELKNEINNYVSKEGISEVTPQNLQIVDAVMSPNLYDATASTSGGYLNKDGTFNEGTSYFVTGYIPVEAGEKYVFTRKYQGNRVDAEMRFVTCYDSDKTVMPSAGSNNQVTQPYTIPAGVAYIRVSSYTSESYSEWQFEKGEVGTAYYPYGALISAVIKNEYLPDDPVDMSDIPAFELVQGQNLFNRNDPDFLTGKYITKAGAINSSDAYVATGFISVTPGDKLIGSYKNVSGNTAEATMGYVACYNAGKTVMSDAGVNSNNSSTFIVPNGVSYVRISIRQGSYTQYLQVEKTDSNYPKPYVEYEAPHYELKESYMFPIPNAPEHVYLPTEIYVAVGRTIELYNELVVLDYKKYHFRWVCGKGKAYARKFAITGDTVGNQNLDLYLYDDKKNLCWIGRCVIHIVAASSPVKKILPIGDSLTNWKAWLQETMLLSSNNITWLGTRYSGQSVDSEGNTYASGTIHHEGRSGWSASDYLADSEYTFDDRYDGAGTVAGTANPFWDGSDFSLSHYLTVQNGVDTPDAVQIFLGTNDIRAGISTAVDNITAMVTKIRAEYPNMPIFVCNTIYNSNQNGYGSVGSDAYSGGAGASAWQYDEDSKIMDLMVGLRDSLKSVTGVYIIPLATCMDREYDFGNVETAVNPRSTITVPMPVERIHPQAPGYYQMADLMYSYYCGILTA